jgi:hypothetical protein
MAESLAPGVSLPYELWHNIFLFVIDLDDNTQTKYAPGTELTGLLRVSRSWEVSTTVQIGSPVMCAESSSAAYRRPYRVLDCVGPR